MNEDEKKVLNKDIEYFKGSIYRIKKSLMIGGPEPKRKSECDQLLKRKEEIFRPGCSNNLYCGSIESEKGILIKA